MLADALIESSDEASNRACISRSYYALYHEALLAASALSLPGDEEVKTAHEKLIRRFTCATKGLVSIGKSIRKQKQLRAMADYEIDSDLNASEARFHLATSKRLVNDLRRITASIHA
ncbi:hypothetical protein ACIPIN_01830 [Pseudomonas sp. NPDC087697]|uniref:hypothetical protein n=1 Tax=Pseudomonas sp. NPDC087697 TaxID=3364447 RepID=UPI00381D215F